MEHEKKIVVGTLVLTVFILLVALSSFYVQTQVEAGNAFGCMIPIYLFIPLLASIGLFIGTLVYYLLSPRFVVKPDKDLLLKLFDSDQRKVIGVLLSNEGSALQSKIVRKTDLSKVKVFRVLRKLKRKGFVDKQPYGKTNKIILKKELKDLFG